MMATYEITTRDLERRLQADPDDQDALDLLLEARLRLLGLSRDDLPEPVVVDGTGASRRLRARRVDEHDLARAAQLRAIATGGAAADVDHGGTVANAYGYSAQTEAALVAALPDGRCVIWLRRIPANKATLRGAAEACLAGAGAGWDGRCGEARKIAARDLVGLGHASELLMTGEFIDARRAAEIGLYNHVVPDTQLEGKTSTIARRLADGPSMGIAVTKRMLNAAASMDLGEAMQAEGWIQAECMKHPDYRESYEAFLEKREPDFVKNVGWRGEEAKA